MVSMMPVLIYLFSFLVALVNSFKQAVAWQEQKPATFLMMVCIASQATLKGSQCNEGSLLACFLG